MSNIDTHLLTITGPSSEQQAIYRPLDPVKREIRIVQLQAGRGDEPVSATLLYATILTYYDDEEQLSISVPESNIPYEAMSYTWDDVTAKATMQLNGREILMPASAVEVLWKFRLWARERLL